MNPERTAVSDHLSAEQAAGVDRACDAFEQAWKAAQATGTSPAIARFLEGCGTIERPVLLRELMALDRAYRQRYGLPIRPEDYRDLAVATGTPIPANAGTDQAAAGVSAPDAPKPLAPGTVVDHYRVLERLGGGGMGVVYKAHDPHLGRTVALKFLSPAQAGDPQQLERFEREARAASALNHPAICTIHASGNHQGQPYLVMEWIDGQTLRTLTGRPLPLDLLARLGRQAAQALAVAHAAGIVHRDIKPDNLMVRSDGYLKVLDFGLARLLPASPVSRPAGADTEPGTLLGTVRYMSPEQARAEPAGSAADVFALGVVLYELATGHHPFPGDSQVEVLNAILYQTPLPPSRLHPDISVALEGLLEQMLAKDAHLRPMAAEVATALAELAGSGAGPSTARAARSTVGRAAELSQLRQGWQSAAGGQGLVLCVTGEAGLGKTTLVEDFLAELAERGPLASVGRGRCSERLAGTEAYLPIVEALEDLLRGDGSERAARLLKLLAPTWYVHVAPQAAADASLERLRKEAQTSSQERLKRELLAFVQELTRLRPLLLFLDDLHWADMSTVDLLAYLGQRCAGLRLLVLLTYRPTELRRGPHPFLPVQRELQGRGVCREIALSFLERADIDRYLALTFPGHAFPAELVALLHARTGGNPLFLCDLVRYLQDRGVLAETQGRWRLAQAVPDLRRELPASVRSLIEQKIARLDEAGRRLLGTASVQGQEFDAAVAAQVLGLDPAAVEEQCELLASVHGLVRPQGEQELPDGTLTLRFQFVHVLYQNALYDALSPARRAALSAAVAQALTGFSRDQPGAIASEVARLWETARDWSRAADAFSLAADNAVRVFAHTEAVALARHGLELLDKLPDSRARAEQELRLQSVLLIPLAGIQGFADGEVGQVSGRTIQLCRLRGETGPLFRMAMFYLWAFHVVRAELATALEVSRQLLAQAPGQEDPAQGLTGHNILGITLVHQGDFAPALEHLRKCPAATEPVMVGYHFDLRSNSSAFAAWALWILGYPDQAKAAARTAVLLAQQFPRSFPLAHAHTFVAFVDQLQRDAALTLQRSETLLELCREEGFHFYEALGTVWHGWALGALGGHEEGLREIRQGRAAFRKLGAAILVAQMFGLEAEVLAQLGQSAAALDAVTEGLAVVERTGERYYEAELHRLRGELLLGRAEAAEAEACFGRALEVARRQQAKSWELRAALSLSRLYQQQGKASAARQLLADVYRWFTEGHDSADLQEARAFLDSLPKGVSGPPVSGCS